MAERCPCLPFSGHRWLDCFPRSCTLAHPRWGQLGPERRSPWSEEGKPRSGLWPWQVFSSCVENPMSYSHRLQVATAAALIDACWRDVGAPVSEMASEQGAAGTWDTVSLPMSFLLKVWVLLPTGIFRTAYSGVPGSLQGLIPKGPSELFCPSIIPLILLPTARSFQEIRCATAISFNQMKLPFL